MMIFAQVFIWLATTKIGRMIALGAVVLIAVFVAYQKVKSIGRREERAKIEAEVRRHKEISNEVDRKVDSMSDADVERRLRRWANDK